MTTNAILDQLNRHRLGPVAVAAATDDQGCRPVTVASYARISDAYEGKETGVTEDGVNRQLKANQHIADARSWVIADKTYTDNSVSAFKEGVVRDAFEEMLDDLEAGLIDGIVCYNLDRFARRTNDLERAIAIYDKARRDGRALVFATAEGDLNLASDDGLTMARVMVAFANKSSRDTARRVSLKHQEIRDEGKQVGGHRPFGWDWHRESFVGIDGTMVEGRRSHVLNPREADAIREAATGLIDGSKTWRGVMREWNAAGLITPRGTEWRPQTVKHVMRSPRLAGWLVHRDAIARHSRTGELIRAKAPGILTDEVYESLLVATDGKGGYTVASGRRKYLLTSIARCAECGSRLSGNRANNVKAGSGGTEYFYYVCKTGSGAKKDGGRACGKVSISGVGLDRLITDLVLPRIIKETADITAEVERPHAARLMEIDTERDSLLTDYREKRASSSVVFPEVTRLEGEADELRRLQAVWARDQRVKVRAIGVTAETWPELDTEAKRIYIAQYIEAVYISRAIKRQGPKFDPSRVSEPVWRD